WSRGGRSASTPSATRSGGAGDLLKLGGPEMAPQRSDAPRQSRGAPRSHQLVTTRGGFAEAAHRVGRQRRVGLVQSQVDLAISEREQAASGAVAFNEKRAEPLDLEDPHRLRDTQLREPVNLAHAPDAAAVRGAHAIAHGS